MKISFLKKHINNIAIFLAIFVLSFFKFSYSTYANSMEGLEQTKKIGFGNNSLKINDVPTGIGSILGVLLSFLGIVFFIIIVYAGFKWMMARDNASEVSKAKEMITSAVIGLIVVLSAYAITSFLGGQLTR
jgi:predicted permease